MEGLYKVLYIVEIVIGIGILIFVHELGHFLVAKLHKVRVEAFSLGFPPNLWKRQWGDTEYRIGLIPLGGYVKMAGEAVGEGKGDPDELTSKSAWARVQIFSAGALINLVIAFPISILACLTGKFVTCPDVSAPSLPESVAGMRPGDTVLEVDGRKIVSREQYIQGMVGRSKGSKVGVRVRHRDGQEEVLQVTIGTAESHQIAPFYTKIREVKPGTKAFDAGLRSGDLVVSVNGLPVTTSMPLSEALRETVKPVPYSEFRYTRPVAVTIRRPSVDAEKPATTLEVTLQASILAEPLVTYPEAWSLVEPTVGETAKGMSVHGVLNPGDAIRRINGRPIKSWQELKDEIEPRGGQNVTIAYERDGATKEVEVRVGWGLDGKGKLGMSPQRTKRIADVPPGSPFEGLLRPGDTLVSIDGKAGQIDTVMIVEQKPVRGKPMEIRIERLSSAVQFFPREEVIGDVGGLGFDVGPGQYVLSDASNFKRYWGFGDAMRDGFKEPVEFIDLTCKLLWKLVSMQESASGLAGPVGIFQASFRSAEQSQGNFFWILMLITVNLGIFNLLPIPVLDGGHILLLTIEKLRGRPNSVAFVNTFQTVGLVLLLSLVILVTVGDIRRLL